MNEIDLENTDLNSDAEGTGVAVAGGTVATFTPTDSPDEPLVFTQTPVGDALPVEDATPVAEAAPAPVRAARKGAGRKVDTKGTTALGAARLLYAANSTLDTKELRKLFLTELGPKFGTSEQVAQTYVSLVRKGKKASA